MKSLYKIIPEIIEELKSKGGQATERELYESLSKRLEATGDNTLSIREFNKILLVLETRGLIRVSILKRNVRSIQLLSEREVRRNLEVSSNGG
ncbi:MAG: hypothetical protein ACP5II_08120 [Infirmifilum sp.]|jgi:Cdc6-like AAA superfamily ATPase|uniref:ArsR family transcriptional regulator n=1 Tax=Infirmifilum uzonense TaxID=1550241 RepID=A0A0F7FIY6_9CREN|nr:hypothetical protein [Infirmifilum uzonense]AKG39248.1 hypothetical protein MA03_08465 [Infirmifilum uzonense]